MSLRTKRMSSKQQAGNITNSSSRRAWGSRTAERVMKFLTERFPGRVASSEVKQHIKIAKIMYSVGSQHGVKTNDSGPRTI